MSHYSHDSTVQFVHIVIKTPNPSYVYKESTENDIHCISLSNQNKKVTAICIAMDHPSLNRDRSLHTVPAIYSQLLSSRDTSDLSNNRESCDDMQASVRWRRPDVTGRKLQTFEDFALVWTFNKFYQKRYTFNIFKLSVLVCSVNMEFPYSRCCHTSQITPVLLGTKSYWNVETG